MSFLLVSSFAHAASIDPGFKFYTTETEHFAIHYHEGLEGLASEVRDIAEDVHCRASVAFRWSPAEKTHLVLIDSSDLANGFATVLPYNLIFVYTVPPLPDMTIAQYHDWLATVIAHEYAHVLTMDASRGYSTVMRNIFGKPLPGQDPLSVVLFFAAAPPNVFMPNWWLEGMATWAESQYTPLGRGKGTYFEMVFRAAALDDNLPTINKVNGEVPYWPSGSSPYIWGLALDRYIYGKYGGDALGELNISHAGRAPYFISAPPARLTGKNYVGLFRDMIEEMRSEQQEKIDVLRSRPVTEQNTLPIEGELITNPRFSRDGSLIAVNRRDPHGHQEVRIFDSSGSELKAATRRLPSDHNISWSPDGGRIYFTEADLERGYNLYQDLYYYDIERDRKKRLTKNIRVKDADLSPDGRRFALISVEGPKQSLALLDAEEGEGSLSLIVTYSDKRVSGPRWSPDGRRIVYSVRDGDGKTSLWIYDSGDGGISKLIEDGHDNTFPTWSPDGGTILFSSDRTGVYNLFALTLRDGKTYQATNVLGGAFQPEVSPDGRRIAFSSYDSKGFNVAVIDYLPASWWEKAGPNIKVDWPSGDETGKADTIKACGAETSKDVPAVPADVMPSRRYSPFGSILPRFWLPTLTADHDGAVAGAFTAGEDVLGRHAYLLEAGAGESGHVYYSASYVYDRLYPRIELSAYKRPVLYSEFRDDEDLFEKQAGAVGAVSFPLRRLETYLRLRIGYHYRRQERLEGPEEVFEGRRDNIFAELRFDNTLRYPYSVSRQEGRIITIAYRDYSRKRGSDVNSREYLASHEEYFGFLDHNVVYLKLKGASSEGEVIPQQAFQLGGTPGEGTEFPLRGYPAGFSTGRYVLTGTLEYRRPIVYILRGIGSKPLFFDRVHVAAFADAGIVWSSSEDFKSREIKVGVGAEARLDLTLGYKFAITPALGFAHGTTREGEDIVYLTIYVDL